MRVILKDPLKSKQLNKGLDQLSEEGAVQVFRPVGSNSQFLEWWEYCNLKLCNTEYRRNMVSMCKWSRSFIAPQGGLTVTTKQNLKSLKENSQIQFVSINTRTKRSYSITTGELSFFRKDIQALNLSQRLKTWLGFDRADERF